MSPYALRSQIRIGNRISLRLINIESNEPLSGLQWKPGKDIKHLEKRKDLGHISQESSMEDYEQIILRIIKEQNSEVYLYLLEGFRQNYFVFGDGVWIVIIGQNGIIETAYIIDDCDYNEYLTEEDGYYYLGKLREVYS